MKMRLNSAASSTSAATGRRSSLGTPANVGPPSTASGSDPSTALKRVEYEVEPRVQRIEQQLQEKLPSEWREFAGKPMQIQYYDQTINTFRENDDLLPSEAYMTHAIKQLQDQLALDKLVVFSHQELREIVLQEWRTDMARCVWQSRLNRHGSKDGPIVKRSRSAVITVASQPNSNEEALVLDALAQVKKARKKS